MFVWHLTLRNPEMMPRICTLATKWCIDLYLWLKLEKSLSH